MAVSVQQHGGLLPNQPRDGSEHLGSARRIDQILHSSSVRPLADRVDDVHARIEGFGPEARRQLAFARVWLAQENGTVPLNRFPQELHEQ